MKITAILALALMSAMMIPAIQQLHAASQTIDGVITDSMCGKKHMMPGKTDTSI
jgi:Na+/proline symporter